MKRVLKWFRLTFGLAAVPEICEASKGRRDYHDYPKSKGGDGTPPIFTCTGVGTVESDSRFNEASSHSY